MVIQRPSPYTAFREPILDWNRIPTRVWADWERKTAGLQDWSKEFQAVDCGDENGLTSADDVRKATEFIDRADLFRAPSKRKRDPTKAEGPFGDEWEFVGHERQLPDGGTDKLDEAIKAGVPKEVLTKALATVEASVVSIGFPTLKMG